MINELFKLVEKIRMFNFYARKQLLLSARLIAIAIPSVCPSVRPSVRHTGGSVKNSAS